jgi:deoxyribonuclease V
MVDIEKLRIRQKEMIKRLSLKDKFEKIETVAGFDQAFLGNKIISAAVVCDYSSLEVIEKQYAVEEVKMPYIPGFLSFREGPAIIKAYRKLKIKPDIIMIDGNGILHPLKAGLATHVGIILDKPTIGVAKSLLLGSIKNKRVYVDGEVRGYELYTKKGCKPIYVSPGHKVSLESSLRIVRKCVGNHKLPEPLRLAHLYANEMKLILKGKNNCVK